MNNLETKSKEIDLTKFIFPLIVLLISLGILLKLEYYENDIYGGKSFYDNNYEYQCAKFIDARYLKNRFNNIYPSITPFFADEVEYFYGNQNPSKAYIKLHYMIKNLMYNPDIDVEILKKIFEFDEVIQYRLIGTQKLNGKVFKFDEKINFNKQGQIIGISDETEN